MNNDHICRGAEYCWKQYIHSKRFTNLAHLFHDHQNHIPHFVVIIPLIHNNVFLILPLQKRNFLSNKNEIVKHQESTHIPVVQAAPP
jgi:hypothetical protein